MKNHIKNGLIVFSVFLFIQINAAEVDSVKALLVAKNFAYENFAYQRNQTYESLKLEVESIIFDQDSKPLLYFINIEPTGYLVVSGDNKAYPILSHSENGKWNQQSLDNMSPGEKYFINGYEQQISTIIKLNLEANKEVNYYWERYSDKTKLLVKEKTQKELHPLGNILWEQCKPYNHLYFETGGIHPTSEGAYYDYKCPVGCGQVATSIVLRYWMWPNRGNSSNSYSDPPNSGNGPCGEADPSYGPVNGDFQSTFYRWDDMPFELDLNTYNDDVSLAIWHSAVAANADFEFCATSSTLNDRLDAFVDYFRYSSTANLRTKTFLTSWDTWENYMVSDIDNGWPINYRGEAGSSAHAFVCWAYQDAGSYYKFKFNWGYGDVVFNNAWYTVRSVNGDTSSVNGWNENQEMINNLFPDGTNDTPCSVIIPFSGIGSDYSRSFMGGGVGAWNNTANSSCGYLCTGVEKLFSFTAPLSGTYSIQVTEASGYVDYMWKSGSCSPDGWNCIDNINSPGTYGSMSWTAGTTYYILLDDEDEVPGLHRFYIKQTQFQPHVSDSLNINNINAGIRADGYLFADIIEVPDQSIEFLKPHFEYPKGSGKSTIFCNSFWIGGRDNNNNLYLAAQRYKQVGWDYQSGPISNNYDENFKVKWNKLWKVDKSEVNYHKNNYWKENYVPVPDIIDWPGNGDVNEGQSAQLAPYFDQDHDGLYEPMQGDYPIIRGDQTVFFMFNDDRPHGETGGNRLKVEIHGMAYAYSMPSNPVMNNSVYIHYDIINRSNKTYNNTYIGVFADTDIGFMFDDFVASNVQNGSFITYNGDEIDGQGEPGSYGANPPAQSITVLAGPFMDNDQADNPDGGCNYSINGLNFGDGVVDNERLGMTGFIYFSNSGGSQGDPQFAAEYYNYLQMKWKDDTKMQYGGSGHVGGFGTVGPECNFMFPGNSDPTNWGSYCLFPNAGYNQNGKYWSEETGDNGNPNPPGDRRGLLTTGPFTFKPGEVQELEMAYVIGQGSDGPMSSVGQLNENLEAIFASVEAGQIIVPNAYLATPEYTANIDHVQVYPNPAFTSITFNCHALANETIIYEIYSITGNRVIQGKCKGSQSVNLNIQNLNSGIYILVIKNRDGLSRVKFVKK